MAQSIVITKVITTAAPAVSARAYAFDASGGLQSLGTTDVGLTENGSTVTKQIQCDPAGGGRNISLMVAADVSSSSRLGIPTVIDMQRAAALAADASLGSASDEIGLVEFDQRAFVLFGLTTNRTNFATAVNAMASGNGSRLSNGLTSEPMGVLTQLNVSRYARTLLLMVDGRSSIDAQALLAAAKTFRVTIYVIGLRTLLNNELRTLADSTGGSWAESVSSVIDAQMFARAFVTDAKRLPGCTISWTSEFDCRDTKTLVFSRGSVSRTFVIATPPTLKPTLETSTTSLSYGEVPIGTSRDLTLSLTARNRAINITNITSSNAAFTIVSGGIPPTLTLAPNQSHMITVRYRSTDSSVRLSKIQIAHDGCGPTEVIAKGGFRVKDDLLQLVSPNGGERFVAGVDTVIAWTGVLPEDVIRIEMSTDDGTSWRSVTEAASGLQHRWMPSATTVSGRIRIEQTVIDQEKILRFEGHTGPVYSADFISGGQRIVTGSHDRNARIWDVAEQRTLFTLRGHRDWVWAVAAHPTQQIVATGSFDGDVRLWNANTGDLLSTIAIGPRVWSLDFSPSGTELAVGYEGGIGLIDVATASVTRTIGNGGSPVYSVDYTPDGSRLITAEGSEANIRAIADLFVSIRRFSGHIGPVYGAAISPDGSVVATVGADRTIKTWNANDASLLRTSEAGVASYLDVEFNANGAQLLVASGDGTAKFYETQSLRRLNALAGHAGLVYTARFDATKRRVITASTDFTARVWDVLGLRLSEDRSDNAFTVVSGNLAPRSIDMGTVHIGSGHDANVTVLQNSGAESAVVRSIRLLSGDVEDFDLSPVDVPLLLAAGVAFVSEARFAPTKEGVRSAIIEVVTGVETLNVTISGRGVQPALAGPSIVNFGRRIANRDRIDTTIAITIPAGGAAVRVTSTVISGPASTPFSFFVAEVPYVLDPGAAHPMRIRYQPVDLGRFAARVTISSEGRDDVVIHLYGEGSGDARIQTSSALVFEAQPCTVATSTRDFVISNTGNSTMTVFEVAIEGPDAAQFAFNPPVGAVPFTLAPAQTRNFTVAYSPVGTGTKTAQAIVVSDALNAVSGRSALQLVARQDSVGFELSRPTVSFGAVPENQLATERLQILNTGTVMLRWPKTVAIDQNFTIVSIKPDITPAGGTSDVVVRFNGGTSGNTYNASYTFVDPECGTTVPMNLVATVKTYIGITVRADSIRVPISSTVDVPIYATQKVNFNRTTVRTFTADVIVNATLLHPEGNTPLGTVNAAKTERTIPMSFTIPEGSDSLAGSIRLRAMWGNDTASVIRITNVVVTDTILVTTRDGMVTFTNLCRQGGARLFFRSAFGLAIDVAPQPSTGLSTLVLSTVEPGLVTATLVDVTGRTVLELIDRDLQPGQYYIPFSTTELPAGPYFIQLTTPSERISRRVDVSK